MGRPHVDEEIAAVLAAASADAQRRATFDALTPQALPELRRQIVERYASLPLSDRVTRQDMAVPAEEGRPEVVLRVHTPLGLTAPAPCLYSMHPGGYVLGHRSMDDQRLDFWCRELSLIGVSVEYRLAPEDPYPAALEDCYAGLRWVFRHAAELGIDRERIGVAGASAGGGLAAAVAIMARDAGDVPLAWQLLAYPMLDDRLTTHASTLEVPVWNRRDNEFGWRCYLGSAYGSDAVPPLASPARVDDLTGLPPTLVFVGTADGFCDEDVEYAIRLERAGVLTELHMYPGGPHGFDRSAADTDLGRRCVRDTTEWLAAALRWSGRG